MPIRGSTQLSTADQPLLASPVRPRSVHSARWLDRLKRKFLYPRTIIAAPFSARYRCRLAWLRERERWREANIPQTHVIKALLHVEDTGAFYIPVPKAANTSILAAIAKKPNPVSGEGLPDFMTNLPANVLQVGCRPADFRSGARVAFTVVRHPVQRFWSAYNHMIVEQPFGSVSKRVRQVLGLAPKDALTPQILLDYIETEPVEDIDHHFRPQFAICAAELLPVRIARCENLVDDLVRLAEEGIFPKTSLAYLGWANRRMSRIVHDRHRYLNSRVFEVYKRDFEVLGY
jgi:hypothetical protein